MRIVFMGTPDFSVPALESLIHSRHKVEAIVTQPDRPKGRGNALSMSPVKETGLKYKIPVFQPERAREASFVEDCPGCDGGGGIWTDTHKRAFGAAKIWMCQYSCFPASKIPGGFSHSVGCDSWG